MDICERFLRYVAIDTQSDESSRTVPSTEKQKNLSELLVQDLLELGLENVETGDNGYVYGFLPATPGCEGCPAIGYIAHLDTSPSVSGRNVKARVIKNYDGKDIILNEEKNIITRLEDFPRLANYKGKTLIVTDGTTLLGADDKSGIANIMGALELLKEVPHGKIGVCFTPDEEIGHGAAALDIEKFGCDFAYTVDGGELGELTYETFNAAGAVVEVKGLNTHTGSAKGIMKNASLIAMEYHALLPEAERPQYTSGYEGFFHLNGIQGDESGCRMSYLIRDHDRNLFLQRKDLMKSAEDYMNRKYGAGTVTVTIRDSYFNMIEVIKDKMEAVDRAREAFRKNGVEPYTLPMRGGTDGASLSFRGLPCPNICTGGFGFHGINEGVCVESMETIAHILADIAEVK